MIKRYLPLLGSLVLVIVLWFLFSLVFNNDSGVQQETYRATINVGGAEGQYMIESDKDGALGAHTESEVKTKLSSGIHTLTVSAEGYVTSSTTVDISKEDQVVIFQLEKLSSVSEDLSKLAGTSNNLRTTNAKYFVNDTWLVGSVGSVEKNYESEIIVAKKIGDAWDTVDQGTFLDTDYLRSIGVPTDLISYVEAIQ